MAPNPIMRIPAKRHETQAIVGRSGTAIASDAGPQALRGLIAGRVACIHVPGYFDPARCGTAVERVIEWAERTGVRDDTNVLTLRPRRELFADGECPMDRFARDLQERWPDATGDWARAGPAAIPFVFRVYQAGSRLRPHIDRASEPSIRDVCREGRLAVNLYLDVASAAGGELLLWDATMPEEDYEEIRLLELEPFRARVCEPAVTIRPAPGDLIVFDAQRIHGVAPLTHGTRVTASCFIGVGGAGDAMRLSVFA